MRQPIYYANGAFVKGRRPEFSSELLKALPVRTGEARCHSVSYETINMGIVNALNYYLHYVDFYGAQGSLQDYYEGIWVQTLAFAAGMICSVEGCILPDDLLQAYLQYKYGEGDQAEQLDVFNRGLIEFAGCMEAPINGTFLRLQEALSHLESVSEDGFLASLAEIAGELVGALNSCKNNLRAGDARWNSSIQSAFDAAEYRVETRRLSVGTEDGEEEVQVIVLNNEADSIRLSNLLHLTLGKDPNVDNTSDALTVIKAINGKGESFFYSSSNRKKDFLRNGEVQPCDCPVLYTDYFVRDAQGDPSERLLELYD
ncbi:MAG: hypothetical protein Q4C48_01905 [Lachnospiraceae bacterium]|nr:hypothetical protein [Lachnospiraceae bacterium]